MNSNASQAYRRIIETSYELALHPQLPLQSLKLLVKCQRMHGVTLISGKDDNHAVSEYLGSIVTAIEKLQYLWQACTSLVYFLTGLKHVRLALIKSSYQNRQRWYTGLYYTQSP